MSPATAVPLDIIRVLFKPSNVAPVFGVPVASPFIYNFTVPELEKVPTR